MKLSILGKRRKGNKQFELKSEDGLGFNIECFKKGKAVKLYNLHEVVWMNHGKNVMLDPMLDYPFDFCEFDDIIIKKANRNEGREQETFYTT